MASVEQIIDSARSNAERMASEGADLLSNAVSASSSRLLPNRVVVGDPGEVKDYNPEYRFPELNASYEAPNYDVDKPAYEAIDTIGDIDYPEPVEINIDALFQHNKPNFDRIPEFTENAPDIDINSISKDINNIPTPSLSVIAEPTLSDVEIGTPPEVTLPTFEQSVTLREVADPPELCAKYQEGYNKVLPAMRGYLDDTVSEWTNRYAPGLNANLALLNAKIEQGMESGKALSEDFEKALYTRARDRAEGERERLQLELQDGVAKRGFSLPPSILNAGRVYLHQQTADNIAQQSTEIAIERAKMEIQHTQFAMQLSQTTSQMLISASLQYAQTVAQINAQALDYAKQSAALAAKAYELSIAAARLNIDILNAEAKVFEAELKSALAVYESFRLELETAKMQVDIDQSKVDLYSKRVQAEEIKVSRYVAILGGIKTRGELEKIKAELYGEKVKAYVASLSGVEAETRVYTAALKGDESKLKGKLAKVDVYTAEVEVANSKQKLSLDKIKAKTDINRSKSDEYRAAVQAYQTEVNAEIKRYEAELGGHRVAMEAVVAKLEAEAQAFKASYDAVVSRAEVVKMTAQADIEHIKLYSDLFTKRNELLVETNVAAGRLYATMAGAALSSQNTMVSKMVTET